MRSFRVLRRLIAAVPFLFGASLALAPAACRTATQITVDVTTDIDCSRLSGTSITVGQLGAEGGVEDKRSAAISTRCDAGRIGALVVFPSGSKDDQAAIKVVTGVGRAPDTCVAPAYGEGCIVARRALRYIPHAALTVPIAMRGSCDGILCDDAKTCVRGQCVDATIPSSDSCRGGGCDEGALEPGTDGGSPDASVDGAPDASVDGAPDAPPPIVACDTTGLQPGAPWPMSGYCPARRARSPFRGPTAKPRVIWSQPYNLVQKTQPLVAQDGTVIITTYSDVQALDGTTGAQKWNTNFAVSPAPETTPALGADGTIYVIAGSTLHAVDLTTGLARGTPFATSRAQGGLTLDATGRALFTDDTTIAIAIQPLPTPSQAWRHSFGVSVQGSAPAIDANGFVYFGTTDAISVLDRNGGFVRAIPIQGQASDTVAVAPDGSLRIQSDPSRMLHSRTATGGFLFDAPTGLQQFDVAIGDDGTTYIGLDDGSMTAIGPTGMVKWKFPGVGFSAPTVDAAGNIYAVENGTGARGLIAIAPGDGHELWRLDLPNGVDAFWGPVIGANGWLYVNGGRVYAVGP